MEFTASFQITLFLSLPALFALLFKYPFLNFPMDEDFAFHTYQSRFAGQGIKWKEDIWIFLPQWKMSVFNIIYGKNPERGILRIRLMLMIAHALTSSLVAYGIFFATSSPLASAVGGILYAFFGTVPALYSHSYNNEQLYIPTILIAFYLLINGYIILGGLFFGIATIHKYSTITYIPAMFTGCIYYLGASDSLVFLLFASLPIIASYLINQVLGFNDEESLKTLSIRFALAMQLSKLKERYGNRWHDFRKVLKRTLPLWLGGIPIIITASVEQDFFWYALMIVTTIFNLLAQKLFSCYTYLPIIALLSIATGGTIASLLAMQNPAGNFLLNVIGIATLFTMLNQASFYVDAVSNKTLARYRKFDQFIYLPHIGKTLKRLIRMRKESGRIFVWGNHIQLYSYTNLPASDQYLHYAIGPWDSKSKLGFFDTVVGGIIKHKPIYIIKTFQNFDISALEKITGIRYKLVKTMLGRYPVYRFEGVVGNLPNPTLLPWQEKKKLMECLTKEGEEMPCINKTDMLIGKEKRALKEVKKLLRLNGNDINGITYYIKLLRVTRQEKKAKEVIDEVKKRNNLLQNDRLTIADMFIGEKLIDDAVRYIEEEERLYGKSENSTCIKASAILQNEITKYANASDLEKNGNKEKSNKLFREIAEKEKVAEISGASWYRLSKYADGEKEKEMLMKCLKLLPTHREAKRKLEILESADA